MIAELEDVAQRAKADSAYPAAIAAEKEIMRLRCRLDDRHLSDLIAAEADPIERAHIMRDVAVAAGSHVAAGAADREAYARTLQAEQAQRAAEQDRLLHLADGDVWAMIAESARDLPADVAASLAAVLLARPDVQAPPLMIEGG